MGSDNCNGDCDECPCKCQEYREHLERAYETARTGREPKPHT